MMSSSHEGPMPGPGPAMSSTVAARLAAVRARIAAAGDGRLVTLVAAGKSQPPETLAEALAAGQRVFGENRVQEAQRKWPALKRAYPDLELHLIGPLQTNKVADALALFDVIETVDREKLAPARPAAGARGRRRPARPVTPGSTPAGSRKRRGARPARPSPCPFSGPPVSAWRWSG